MKGDPTDTHEQPTGQIRNTRKLLFTAALIMSVGLLGSSLVTTLLIPPEALPPGATPTAARSRSSHKYMGEVFGTVYDISTIAILWFAGASAWRPAEPGAALPSPYGMAPDWARATRPLVLVFTAIAFFVTWYFDADVDAQGGAYATGVLFLMTTAAVAVTIASWQTPRRWVYGLMSAIFIYTTATNIYERPEGIKIASFFIAAIVAVSFGSRAIRSTELARIRLVAMSDKAGEFIDEIAPAAVRIIAHRPDKRTVE